MSFVITSERGSRQLLQQETFSHVISIVDPGNAWTLHTGKIPKLELRFHDEEDPVRKGPIACSRGQVEAAAQFLSIPRGLGGHVMIHCWAGSRRSGAIGFMFACMLLGEGKEKIAAELTNASAKLAMNPQHEFVTPQLKPNRRIVRLADELLDRDGRMIQMALRVWPRKGDQ